MKIRDGGKYIYQSKTVSCHSLTSRFDLAIFCEVRLYLILFYFSRKLNGPEDGTYQKQFGVRPTGFGKQRLKLYDERQQLDRQRKHIEPFLEERPVAYSACRPFFKDQIG